MDEKKVIVIGSGDVGHIGKAIVEASKLNPDATIVVEDINKHVNRIGEGIIIRPDSGNNTEPYIIKARPELDMPWIDPNEPVFNEAKHKATCLKNRVKRKRKRK